MHYIHQLLFLYFLVFSRRKVYLESQVHDHPRTSEAPPSSTPDPKWLDAFNGGRSFILHARQPRITDGPSFDFIWRALMDQRDWDFDSDHIGQWINAMLMAHGFAKEVGFVHETVPLMAQYAVFYGLVASRK